MMKDSLLNRQERQFEEVKDKIDYIFLGDSRTVTGINPELIPRSFNYASLGEQYFQTYLKAKKVVEETNVKRVFLQYDFHIFLLEEDFNDHYFWKGYMNFVREDDFESKDFDLLSSYGVPASIFSYVASLKVFFESIIRSSAQEMINGYQPKKAYRKQNKENLEKRVLMHFPSGEIEFNEDSNYYFGEIIELFQKHNIEVTIIKYPVSNHYNLELIKRGIKLDKFKNHLRDFLKKYNLQVLNLATVFFDNKCYVSNCPNFYDYDHLNEDGANKISDFIAKTILKIENK